MTIRGIDTTPAPRTWLGSNGIIYHDLSGFSHLTLEMVDALHRGHLRVAGNDSRAILILADGVLTIDFEVQLFASHPRILSSVSSLAIVGSSFMLRHLSSMFLSYHRPAYPVEVFDTREEAEAWLLGSEETRQGDLHS